MSKFQCRYILYETMDVGGTDNQTNNSRITVLPERAKIILLPYNLSQYYLSSGLFEKNLIEWSKQFCDKQKIMLDIGAHTGTYAINLSSYSKKVVCFEPQKSTYYALCGSISLSNLSNVIDCHHIGLGNINQVGKQTLYITSEDGGGSSLIQCNQENISMETVEIRTLDSFQLDNIGFIKMDVEGNEYNILEGAKETLIKSNYPTILFESNTPLTNNSTLVVLFKELHYNIHPINGYANMFLASSQQT